MNLCILEICPSVRSNNIELFNDYDHYFVTYENENKDAISFNKGKSWAYNRNYLYNHVKDMGYDYYMFIDYDIDLKKVNCDDIMKQIEYSLKEYSPIMYRTSVFNDELKNVPTYSVGGFINNSLTVLRIDIAEYIFPIPTKFGGFWDGASWINTIVVPIFNNSVLIDYTIFAHNTMSSKYIHNTNNRVGNASMDNLYKKTTPVYKSDLIDVHDNVTKFKMGYMNKRKPSIDAYINVPNIDQIINGFYNVEELNKLKKELNI